MRWRKQRESKSSGYIFFCFWGPSLGTGEGQNFLELGSVAPQLPCATALPKATSMPLILNQCLPCVPSLVLLLVVFILTLAFKRKGKNQSPSASWASSDFGLRSCSFNQCFPTHSNVLPTSHSLSGRGTKYSVQGFSSVLSCRPPTCFQLNCGHLCRKTPPMT